MTFAYGSACWKGPPPICCHLSGWNLVEYVIFCHILWWISYWFLILLSKQKEEWCNRFLTLSHGCIISYTTIKDILTSNDSFDLENTPLSEYQKKYLSIILSYFFFDLTWMYVFGHEKWVIYFHHFSSIFVVVKIMASNFGGVGISYGVAGLEITNPYLQTRWFLRSHGYMNTPLYIGVELWFFSSFLIIRLVGGTLLLFKVTFQTETDYIMKLSVLCMYVVSLVLSWQILLYIKKKYIQDLNGRKLVTDFSSYFRRRMRNGSSHVGFTDNNTYIPPEERRSETLQPLQPLAPQTDESSSAQRQTENETEGEVKDKNKSQENPD